jgi:glutamate decarboxylase
MKEKPLILIPAYGSRHMSHSIPKYKLHDVGVRPEVALDLIRDEVRLDGDARLNLATFVTTYMDENAEKLMQETADKNMIDKDEYPQTAEIENRCTTIIADLWKHKDPKEALGFSCVGSSEAVMLGGLALKFRWAERRKEQNLCHSKPNLILGSNTQICWDKFCRYWDVEPRFVPVKEGRYCLGVEEAIKLCDENTIGVVAILGSTFTGEYEDVKGLNKALEKYNSQTGHDISIHVDAASGGFVAPFLQPKLEWDFRLKWVASINSSGHKYGLVYPGLGWLVFADRQNCPKELIFNVNYLGSDMPTLTLNFSRPASQIIAQYYNFLRLGYSGYKAIHQTSQNVALYLSDEIEKTGLFEILSRGNELPVLSYRFKKKMNFTLFELSDRLRMKGFQVPAYTMPDNLKDLVIMRMVIREGFTMQMADNLMVAFRGALDYFKNQPGRVPEAPGRTNFDHSGK